MFDRRDYSVIPVRACHMVKRAQSWRVLAALGNYASGWGLCYPAQRTLGELAGNMDQGDVSRALKNLHQLGPFGFFCPRAASARAAFSAVTGIRFSISPMRRFPATRRSISAGARGQTVGEPH